MAIATPTKPPPQLSTFDTLAARAYYHTTRKQPVPRRLWAEIDAELERLIEQLPAPSWPPRAP